jgi:glycosyltransferase involved in cell wall biosynthesis
MRAVFWGTFDLGKPRNRILLRGLRSLRATGAEVVVCHREVWGGVEDKSRLSGLRLLGFLLRWLLAYPGLIARYLRLPRHDAVLVGYLGQLDVLVLWPFARLRGVPVVWDAFLSLHDTVVEDRKLVPARHPLARLLFAWEWLACRAAARVILDTRAHAEHFARTFRLPPERVGAVFVGAEPEAFPPKPIEARDGAVRVLFYGQLIPLHGVETILRAARAARDEGFEWTLIGQGQEEDLVRRMLAEEPLERLRWIPWVPYEDLARWIHDADICLGIFGGIGDSGKAARVIPNKVFQAVSAGRPLVTRDSPAVRELLAEGPGVYLVPPADPDSLLEALRRFRAERQTLAGTDLHAAARERILPRAIGRELLAVIEGR